jgi:hypothetical protein
MTKNQSSFGEICKVANQIRKEKKCSQKEAFALAKAQLAAQTQAEAPVVNDNANSTVTKEQFVKMLEAGSVKFSFKNNRGVVNTTKGTLNPDMITKTRKIAGAKVAKNPEGIVFYDRIHGVYRTLLFENLVKVF